MSTYPRQQRRRSSRPIAIIVAASGISSLGDWVYLTALPVAILMSSGDVLALGLIGVARLLPFLLLSIPAGVVADRLSRRAILTTCETIRGAVMVAMAWVSIETGDVAMILALAMIAAAAGTFSMPAQSGLLPDLATDDAELGRANVAMSTIDGFATVIGPALAGVLILLGGLPLTFALNGLSFLAIVLAIVTHWRALARPAAFHATNTRTGGRTNDPSLLQIARRIAHPLLIDGAVSMGASSLGVMAVVVAMRGLGAGEAFTGALNAGAGAGAIAGGMMAGFFVNRAAGAGTAASLFVSAAAIVALGLLDLPLVALIASAVAYGGITMLDTLNVTAVQRLTVDGTTGRAFGMLNTLAALWMMVGAAVPTLIAHHAGIELAMSCVALTLLVIGSLALGGRSRTWFTTTPVSELAQ